MSEQVGQILAEKIDVEHHGPSECAEPFRAPEDMEDEVLVPLRTEHSIRILEGYLALAKTGDCDPDWLFEHVGYAIKMGALGLIEEIVEAHSPHEQASVREAFSLGRSDDWPLESWRLRCWRFALIVFLSKLVEDKKACILQEASRPCTEESTGYDDPAPAHVHDLGAVA